MFFSIFFLSIIMEDILELLSTEPYNVELADYTYVPHALWKTIPLGSYIKYIDRDLCVNNGGFLCRYVSTPQIERRTYVLKRGNNYINFKPFFKYIFYKKEDVYTEQQKNLLKVRKYKKVNISDTLRKLLPKL